MKSSVSKEKTQFFCMRNSFQNLKRKKKNGTKYEDHDDKNF